jgi:hypothetical protein
MENLSSWIDQIENRISGLEQGKWIRTKTKRRNHEQRRKGRGAS